VISDFWVSGLRFQEIRAKGYSLFCLKNYLTSKSQKGLNFLLAPNAICGIKYISNEATMTDFGHTGA
jgi:hypothetical protein